MDSGRKELGRGALPPEKGKIKIVLGKKRGIFCGCWSNEKWFSGAGHFLVLGALSFLTGPKLMTALKVFNRFNETFHVSNKYVLIYCRMEINV